VVAPADWEEVRLGEHSLFFKGNGLSKSQLIDDGPKQCVHYGELFTHYGSVIDTVTSNCVEFGGSFKSLAGDVLMPGSDVTPKGLATASAIKVSGVVLGGDIIVIRSNPISLYGPFLSNFIRISKGRVLRLVKGSTVYHIHAKDLADLKVLKPSVKEQEAIAEALSDADAAIESLDALIAKKRDVKQAAMQQLLTGRSRLPGFTGDWEEARLGACLSIMHGKNQSQILDAEGKYPILATGGVVGRTNSFLSNKPSVLIGRKGTIDRPQFMDTPFWTVDTLFYSDIADGNSAKFLFYKFMMIDWKRYNEASGVPSLSSRTIENIEVWIPSLKEQEAIAERLSVMDDELEALTGQVSKLRMVKEGMMQDLLTGKVRLV